MLPAALLPGGDDDYLEEDAPGPVTARVVTTVALKEDAPRALLGVVTTLSGGGCSRGSLSASGGDDDCCRGGCSCRLRQGGDDDNWREEHFSVLTDCPRASFSWRLQTVEEEPATTIGGGSGRGVTPPS